MELDPLRLTQDMVAIRSVSQQGNVDISDFIESQLKDLDFEIERLEYEDEQGVRKVNLVAKKGQGAGGLGLFSHSDTVPGQEEDWAAFDPVVKEGRLFGRGSCDMKGPLAATIVAAAQVDAADLQQPLFIVVTADEEIGLVGAKYVAEHSELLRSAPPRYGIVAEPTRLIPVYAHKGYALIWVTAYGKAAHTSTGLGISANFRIAPFLAEMAELAELFKSDPSFMNDEFSPPSNGFNLIINDGDTKVNVTAPKTVCNMAFRVMPNARSKEVLAMIVEKAKAYDFEVTSQYLDALYVPPQSDLVTTACQLTGTAQPEVVSYCTDGVHFKDMMDLVILGPGDIAVAHTVGESIEVAELTKAVDLYKALIDKYCA